MSPRAAWDRIGDRFRALSRRDRRAVILGAMVVVPALTWIGLARPYLEVLEDLRDRAAAEHALLERELAVLREAPSFPGQMREARLALVRWDARFVRSPNLALAEAEVTSLLEAIARDSRVLLQEVGAMATGALGATAASDGSPEGLRPIRLSVRGESDFEGVLRFLHGMEENPLLLRIVGLSMRRAPQEGEGRGDDGERRQPGAMSFELIVEAFAPG